MTFVRTENTRESQWHQECFEQHSFHCRCCGSDFSEDDFERHDDGDNDICEICWNDYYDQCDRCEETVHTDHLFRTFCENDNEESWCEDCRDNHAAYDSYDETYVDTEHHVLVSVAGDNIVCQGDIDRNPRDFTHCAGSQKLILLKLHDTYTEFDGRIWSIDYAETNGIPITHRRRPAFARAEHYRGDIGSARGQLKAIIMEEMSNRPAPAANPYHDKIFLGIELEAQAGYYFIDAPHRMLHKELPDTRIIHDGSIKGEGWEFLPPIIKKKKDWEKIEKVISTLNDFKWTADSSCGMHLHLSHGMLSSDHPEVIRTIFRMFYWLEPIIFNCLPLNRRNNKYCYPISKYFDEKDMGTDLKLDYWYYSNFWKKQIRRQDGNGRAQHYRYDMRTGRPTEAIEFGDGPYKKANMDIDKQEHYYVGRYIGCNLHALFQKGTLELRYFPGFLDYNYIRNWAEIITRIISAGIEGIKIEPIIEMSKGRGNMEKAIKEMAAIFKLSPPLANFMKMEYRKYLKNPEQEEPKHETLVPFVNAQTRFRNFAQNTETQPQRDITHTIGTNNTYLLVREDGMNYEYNEEAHENLVRYVHNHILPDRVTLREAAIISTQIHRDTGRIYDPQSVHTWIQAYINDRLPNFGDRQDRPRDEHGRFMPANLPHDYVQELIRGTHVEPFGHEFLNQPIIQAADFEQNLEQMRVTVEEEENV